MVTSLRRITAVAAALALPTVALAACAPGDDGLSDAVGELTTAVETGDVTGFDTAAEQLVGYPAEVTAAEPVREGDTATVDLTVTREIEGNEWSYEVPAELTLDADAGWQVAETPQLIADGLEEGETIVVSREYPERAGIVGAEGREIVAERPVTRYGLDKSWVDPDQVASSARRIAKALGVDPDELAGRAAQMGDAAFVEAIVLRPEDAAERVPDDFAEIPGANAVDDTMFLAPTSGFAGDLLGTVGEATAEAIEESDGAVRAGDVIGLSGLQAAYDEQLRGTPAVTVSAVSGEGEGEQRRTLAEWPAEPAEPLATTLDVGTQMAADAALAEVGGGASLVAIRPSTGAVLAAANSPETGVFSAATVGQYAPGSTFKVVTSLALIRGGMSPDDAVTCADTVTVDGYEFHNYGGYPAAMTGEITLREAVANSCNTAMISSRNRIDGVALQQAAASLGLGTGAELGFPAFLGDVPVPEGETEYAADTIGQGTVLASPLAMATVAASVAAQETVQPHLIEEQADAGGAAASTGDDAGSGADGDAGEQGPPLTEEEAETLHSLMRSVVADGSASALNGVRPEVAAKTGTAEYGEPDAEGDLPTHAWMIATQGDLAVAVFVEDGDSGADVAGPIVAGFLAGI